MRSRLVDERHPIAGLLFRAAGLTKNGTLVLSFNNPQDAGRAAGRLTAFRQRGKIAPPGSFDLTERDPNGEGIGHFDRIVISVHGAEVHLRHLPEGYGSLRAKEIKPISVRVIEPEEGRFDVV